MKREDRNGKLRLGGRQDHSGQGWVGQAQSRSQAWDAPTRWRCAAGSSSSPVAAPPARGPPGQGREEWLVPHRAGQFGKILPRELDHISHPQDGAEGGLVGVEAACLQVGGSQAGKEVSPGEERARSRVNARTVTLGFSSSRPEPQGPRSLGHSPSPLPLSPHLSGDYPSLP